SHFPQNARNLEKAATVEQLNHPIDVIPSEFYGDNGDVELEFLDDSLNPLIISRPINFARDPTKLNVDFQAKVQSKNHPMIPIRGGISTNVQLANQAKLSHDVLLSNGEASKEYSSEEDWIKSAPRSSRDAKKEGNRKNVTLYVYVPDIENVLKEKFAKASMKLGVDVGVPSKKDEDVSKIDASAVDNHSGGTKNYIRLCGLLSDGLANFMQKLRGKDCVKLPASEFNLEPSVRKKGGAIRLVGLKIGRKTGNERDYKDSENESNEKIRRGGATGVEDSVSDVSANYDESSAKVADKFGRGLRFRMINGNLLNDGKLSLSASTALKV
ncbi:uncharacterized protein, partial [Cardiocondyla obscurior]|uniref:uncharacterized protein n=1 Tax=Cardiocondyla obscurior TaxID=286306 RepID=UPI003965885F